MSKDSQNVEILNNRHKTSGKSHFNIELKKFFNKKSTIIYTCSFIALVAIVAFGFNSSNASSNEQMSSEKNVVAVSEESKTSPVDEASEASIVANLAETANLPVAATTAERSVSISVMQNLSQDTGSSIAKPQIVNSSAISKDVTTRVVKDGESIDSIASETGISVQTIKWTNGLKTSEVKPGDELKILPVDGVIHTIDDNETVQNIADKYGANIDRIVSYNDLELNNPTKGSQIIIPGGVLPEKERPEYEAPKAAANNTQNVQQSNSSNVVNSSSNSNLTASVGNKYAYGYCTWYVYERRVQLGRPIGSFWGNAVSWASSAMSAGFTVNRTPAVGAIMQNGGGYGHVAIVEAVNADGSLEISEMNGPAGWNVVGYRTVSAASAGSYMYIH